MIERIYTLCLTIIKSEVSTITQCLELGHETMVCAVCLSIFLLHHISIENRAQYFQQFSMIITGDEIIKIRCFMLWCGLSAVNILLLTSVTNCCMNVTSISNSHLQISENEFNNRVGAVTEIYRTIKGLLVEFACHALLCVNRLWRAQ